MARLHALDFLLALLCSSVWVVFALFVGKHFLRYRCGLQKLYIRTVFLIPLMAAVSLTRFVLVDHPVVRFLDVLLATCEAYALLCLFTMTVLVLGGEGSLLRFYSKVWAGRELLQRRARIKQQQQQQNEGTSIEGGLFDEADLNEGDEQEALAGMEADDAHGGRLSGAGGDEAHAGAGGVHGSHEQGSAGDATALADGRDEEEGSHARHAIASASSASATSDSTAAASSSSSSSSRSPVSWLTSALVKRKQHFEEMLRQRQLRRRKVAAPVFVDNDPFDLTLLGPCWKLCSFSSPDTLWLYQRVSIFQCVLLKPLLAALVLHLAAEADAEASAAAAAAAAGTDASVSVAAAAASARHGGLVLFLKSLGVLSALWLLKTLIDMYRCSLHHLDGFLFKRKLVFVKICVAAVTFQDALKSAIVEYFVARALDTSGSSSSTPRTYGPAPTATAAASAAAATAATSLPGVRVFNPPLSPAAAAAAAAAAARAAVAQAAHIQRLGARVLSLVTVGECVLFVALALAVFAPSDPCLDQLADVDFERAANSEVRAHAFRSTSSASASSLLRGEGDASDAEEVDDDDEDEGEEQQQEAEDDDDEPRVRSQPLLKHQINADSASGSTAGASSPGRPHSKTTIRGHTASNGIEKTGGWSRNYAVKAKPTTNKTNKKKKQLAVQSRKNAASSSSSSAAQSSSAVVPVRGWRMCCPALVQLGKVWDILPLGRTRAVFDAIRSSTLQQQQQQLQQQKEKQQVQDNEVQEEEEEEVAEKENEEAEGDERGGGRSSRSNKSMINNSAKPTPHLVLHLSTSAPSAAAAVASGVSAATATAGVGAGSDLLDTRLHYSAEMLRLLHGSDMGTHVSPTWTGIGGGLASE